MEAAVRWSPRSTQDRQRFLLVDVSQSNLTLNQVDSIENNRPKYHEVARCGKLPPFGAFDWSRTDESIVALGENSGSASLVKLRDDGQQSNTLATFKIRQPRKCNSIAFSTRDWLAVAVDKTRSDVCLFVYDTNREQSGSADAIRKLCTTEMVSSVRFFPSHPQELVATTQRAYIRLYDLRDGSNNPGASIQAPTRCVNNIAIDPLDEKYFASAGSMDDPTVTVWDKRWMQHASAVGSPSNPVFEFRPAVNHAVKTSVWSIRYSGQRRGRLGISSSTGELKVVDMAEGQTSQVPSAYRPHNAAGGAHWNSNCYVSETRVLERPWHDSQHRKDSKNRTIAFDWMNDTHEKHHQPLLALRPNREVDVMHVSNFKPHAHVTARDDFSLIFDELSVTEPKITPPESSGRQTIPGDGSAELSNGNTALAPDSLGLRSLLSSSALQRHRCENGYLFNTSRNREIVGEDFQLQRLWEIVGRYQEQAAREGMVHAGFDLAYVGVSRLWSEDIGSSPNRQVGDCQGKVEEVITGLNASNGVPSFEGERTHFPEHRQLCLAICGWKFTTDTLAAECQELVDRGLHYQAVVQAVLHDYNHIALNILRSLVRTKTIENNGLGPLLASATINDEQREMCLWMAADTDDQALKALLTFLTTGNWRDVMKTSYLHLGYRVALGLKYLNDTELSGFLQSETARAVKNGDLEGLLLTGLGSTQGMDLLQTYIARTNDVQTAVLAAAFTNPLFITDLRFDIWKDTYLAHMQTWRAIVPRANFTVQHNALARPNEHTTPLTPRKQQIALQCKNCERMLVHPDSQTRKTAPAATAPPRNMPVHMAHAHPMASKPVPNSAGVICPHCGSHMQRCGVCKQWLGAPDPRQTVRAQVRSREERNPSHPHLEGQGRSVANKGEKNRNAGAESSHTDVDGDDSGDEGRTQGVDPAANSAVFCARCGHGLHFDHAKLWFAKYALCAQDKCGCACGGW